jgi:tetratricopeptide (TPR) repeat protein
MEHLWTQEVVVPYVQSAYPKETHAMRKWVAHRGGLMLPLDFFAGDNRRTERNGLERLVFATSTAFERWVEELPKLATLTASRLAFAWELHYADRSEQCLTVLNRILESGPSDVPTLTCKADTLVHLERLDDALACAEKALGLDPTSADAWETRGDVFECRRDWNGLLDNCVRWEAAGKMKRSAQREMLTHRAIAYWALGDESRMEACLQRCQSRSCSRLQ